MRIQEKEDNGILSAIPSKLKKTDRRADEDLKKLFEDVQFLETVDYAYNSAFENNKVEINEEPMVSLTNKDLEQRIRRSVEKVIEPSNAIEAELFGTLASGLLTIDGNEIKADLVQDCNETDSFVIQNIPAVDLNIIASTHYKKIISLVHGRITNKSRKNSLDFKHLYLRTAIEFDFAVTGIKISSYDDAVLTRADFYFESLGSFFKDIQNDTTDLFVLKDNTRVSLNRSESHSFNGEETKVTRQSFLKLEFSEAKSLREIIEKYLKPVKTFLGLLNFENVEVTKVSVCDDLNRSNLYSPLFRKSTKFFHSNLDLDKDSAFILGNFIDNFQKYSHHVNAAFDFENTSVSNLYPLMTEVEKAYSLYKPNGLATEYQSQASELMASNSTYFRTAVQKVSKWSKRIKSHRTHLMHKGERIDYDKATIEELYSIVCSLRWVFFLLLVQDLGCDKKFKHQVKESYKFERDCNQIKENLYHGLVSNEVEPRVSYTDSFYINKLAEIYELSEGDRDLMIEALKPWKNKTSVTADM